MTDKVQKLSIGKYKQVIAKRDLFCRGSSRTISQLSMWQIYMYSYFCGARQVAVLPTAVLVIPAKRSTSCVTYANYLTVAFLIELVQLQRGHQQHQLRNVQFFSTQIHFPPLFYHYAQTSSFAKQNLAAKY
jgi:hypothetical protein